ncbi:hypothetical protein [Branchiibius cervicis]|uniref:Uncharacterized protein n=1 Tax=Branchiibius cervicis TaxID=908252 RepID=A0ABW2AVH7_9MICO
MSAETVVMSFGQSSKLSALRLAAPVVEPAPGRVTSLVAAARRWARKAFIVVTLLLGVFAYGGGAVAHADDPLSITDSVANF